MLARYPGISLFERRGTVEASGVRGDDGPPVPEYLEDAHAKQYDRTWPQWDAKRFAEKVRSELM